MCIDSLKLSLRQVTSPVQLEIGLLHREELKFLILEESTVDLIHGRPWLLLHSPTLSWKTGEVTKWGPECSGRCLPVVSPFQAVPIIALLPLHALHCMPPLWRAPLIRPVPPQYKQFEDVFCPDLCPVWLWPISGLLLQFPRKDPFPVADGCVLTVLSLVHYFVNKLL